MKEELNKQTKKPKHPLADAFKDLDKVIREETVRPNSGAYNRHDGGRVDPKPDLDHYDNERDRYRDGELVKHQGNFIPNKE